MLTIVTGRSGWGKTQRVLDALRQDAEAGRRAYLLVPEQQTVESERMLASQLPPSAQLSIEALNFTRLADTVFRTYGGVSYRYVKKSARPVLLWRAMRQVAPAMTEYGATLNSHGALSTMYAAIRELKSSGISAKALSEAAERMEEGSRRRRLADLSLLYAAFEAQVEEAYADTDDLLFAAAERLRGKSFFAGAHVYLDGFHGFSAGEVALLREILRGAENVTVTLLLGGDSPAFYSTEKTLRHLSALAGELSVPLCRVDQREDLRHGDPGLTYLCDNLWRFAAPAWEGECEAVRLYECADEFDECERVAHAVAIAVRGGRRYGELAVIARDSAKYSGILEAAFDRYHIPYYFSVRTDVNKMPLIKLLCSALAVKNHGYRAEDVIAYLKCGYAGFTDREVDVFEQYLKKWRISGRSFTEPDAFTRYPSGYAETASTADAELLLLINDVRDRLLRQLEPYFAALRAAGNAREAVVATYDFLLSLDIRRRIAEEMERRAEDTAAVHTLRQLWTTLTDALDVIATSLGDEPVSGDQLLLLLRTIFDDTDIGTIPPSDDCVTVCDATRMRRGNWHEVFLLGACDGEFPQSVKDGGFFSEADKIALEGEGVVLASREEELTADELLYFYTAAAAPSEILHLCRRRADFAGGERHPSSGYARVLALFPALHPQPAPTPLELALTPESAAYALPSATGEEREALLAALDRQAPPSLAHRDTALSPETADAVFGGDLYLSSSRIESFVKCRFGYGCRYLLGLKEERGPEFSPVDIGNFVHRVLELFLSYLKDNNIEFSDLDSGKIDEIADEVIEGYIIRLVGNDTSVRMQSLFEKLKRNSVYLIRNLVEEFSASLFRPRFFELPISASSEVTPTPIRFPLPDGTTLSVGGIADRVDTYEKDGKTYVRIVDYKTGEKEFAYSDVLRGLNLQLLIYLFSVCKTDKESFLRVLGENPTPAGILYFSAKPPKVDFGVEHVIGTEEAERLEEESVAAESRRSGLMLSDRDVILAQDPGLTMSYVPKFKVGKDGSWKLGDSYRDGEGMEAAFRDVGEVLARIGTEMKSGELSPRPQRDLDPCAYCRYKMVCRSAAKSKGR